MGGSFLGVLGEQAARRRARRLLAALMNLRSG
jgi:hypothetical protein